MIRYLNSMSDQYLSCALRKGLSEPELYCDLVYKFKKIIGTYNFSTQFIWNKFSYNKIQFDYNINVMQQAACLLVNPITIANFVFLFICTLASRTSDSIV